MTRDAYRMRRKRQPVPAGFRRGGMRDRRSPKLRLLVALAIAAFALFSYFGSKEFNPITGEQQYLSMTPRQETALGLQAAPHMIQQHGGLHPNPEDQEVVDQVGARLLKHPLINRTPWPFEFHLLADSCTVNAFALPGGQVFITAALYHQLETEGQLAGVLGHEIAHVLARHSAQRVSKGKLTQGLTGAVMAASGSQDSARLAQTIGQLVNMKFGREDELQSDQLGVRFMADAGYDPRAMIQVMEILGRAHGRQPPPEFFSTHPNPDNRIGRIEEAIHAHFGDRIPEGLTP